MKSLNGEELEKINFKPQKSVRIETILIKLPELEFSEPLSRYYSDSIHDFATRTSLFTENLI